MSVQRKPKRDTGDIDLKAAELFISGAQSESVSTQKAKKIPIALRFDADLLSSIDAMATKRGMSRNAIISYWCSRSVEQE